MSCDVIYVKYWLKNAQISANDFGKPPNWDILIIFATSILFAQHNLSILVY